MLNKKLILLFVIVLLSIASFVLAQEREIKDYKVQQGDTLWDISKKELNDPFLWPKVWKENPGIANPDKLVPGQTVKIPLYLIQKEVKNEEPIAEPVTETAPRKPEPVVVPAPPKIIKPLVDASLYMASGYIAASVDTVGRVAGSPSRKNLSGLHDLIYLTTKTPAKIGDKFYVIKRREVFHPANGRRVGEMVHMLGIAEVVTLKRGETVARVLKSFDEIVTGNWLIAYSDMTPPVVHEPYRKPKVEGYVIDTRDRRLNNGMYDIVYLDKGKNAGLEVGDVMRAITVEKQLEGFTTTDHTYPHGIIQLIKVYDTTSVGVVRGGVGAIDSILRGYRVVQYDYE